MQHSAVIYAKAEKLLYENIFQVQQLAAIYIIQRENRWDNYLTGLRNEMDIFIRAVSSQRLHQRTSVRSRCKHFTDATGGWSVTY